MGDCKTRRKWEKEKAPVSLPLYPERSSGLREGFAADE